MGDEEVVIACITNSLILELESSASGPAGGNQGAGVFFFHSGLNTDLPLPCGEPWL